MTSTRTLAKRFRVALSFPGEHRAFVANVADYLAKEIGKERVLYDEFYEAEFARPDLDTYLQDLYQNESELIAVFLCSDYQRKEWPRLEWRALRDVIKQQRASAIMPFRFDMVEIPGLFSSDGYIWIGDRDPKVVAALILERLQSKSANLSIGSKQAVPAGALKLVFDQSYGQHKWLGWPVLERGFSEIADSIKSFGSPSANASGYSNPDNLSRCNVLVFPFRIEQKFRKKNMRSYQTGFTKAAPF
jgi:hypothetical protein